MPEITRIIREELDYQGVSVIIPQRECMQTLARKQRQKRAAAEGDFSTSSK
jgi:indolepyruvate ferredoxin oxidoreductase alpha subunit